MLRVGTLAALVCAALAHHAVPVAAAMWRVPLVRHECSTESALRFLEAQQLAAPSWASERARVWEATFPSSLDRARSSTPVDFFGFSATVHVGTPPQPVQFGLDLMSADLHVLNHQLDGHPFYDHAKSSTYQANGTHVKIYEGTTVELAGFVSRDSVRVGGGADAAEVHGQSLVELEGPDKTLKEWAYCGAFGIGPHAAKATGAPSIVRTMIDQGLLDKPVVGLHFDGLYDAHAMFGGTDDAFVDPTDVTYLPLDPAERVGWSFPLESISVDGKPIGGAKVALLTGLPFNLGPPNEVAALAEAVGAKTTGFFYALSCDGTGPEIAIGLSGTLSVPFTKEEYTGIPYGEGTCLFNFVPTSAEWLLGSSFFKHVYTVLDFGASEGQERIGFANLRKRQDATLARTD